MARWLEVQYESGRENAKGDFVTNEQANPKPRSGSKDLLLSYAEFEEVCRST
jgi:hypothetical protein